jgi:CDP-glucose 4,6-dehydratase
MNLNYWRDKSVFVTGHTGFKGAWLSLWLKHLGANVTGYALKPPTSPSLFDACQVDQEINSHIGDINNFDQLRTQMLKAEPEVVFHLAAQSLVLESYEDPLNTYMTNVMGTAHVLESIRQCKSVSAVVNITTDKCYENKEWYWGYRENEAMGGHDPYSSSKGCSELLTTSYQKSFFTENSKVNLASARAGNVIGGGDWAENRLVPDFIKAITAGKTLLVRRPNSIRPWQHVLEPLAGYINLAEKLASSNGQQYAEGWNFGPYDHDAMPVIKIAERLCSRWGNGAKVILDKDNVNFKHEATYLKLDCSKAHTELGWRPVLGIETALDWIIEWYRRYNSKGDIKTLTLDQIKRYQSKLSEET